MHDKLFFSLAIELSHCSKHTKFTIFLSYQASLAYNPKEFLGVITNWRRCRGEEIEAQLPWEMTLDLLLDDRQGLDITLVVIIYLATP
jgi:hypothetical protein